MTELPAGDGPDGRHVALLGGAGLAVSRHSRQPELAKDLVRWLTSPEEQKRRALAGPFEPSLQALYQDPELMAQSPIIRRWPGRSRPRSFARRCLRAATTMR